MTTETRDPMADDISYVVRELAKDLLRRRRSERLAVRLRDEGCNVAYLPDLDRYRANLPDGTPLGTFAAETVAVGVAIVRVGRAALN